MQGIVPFLIERFYHLQTWPRNQNIVLLRILLVIVDDALVSFQKRPMLKSHFCESFPHRVRFDRLKSSQVRKMQFNKETVLHSSSNVEPLEIRQLISTASWAKIGSVLFRCTYQSCPTFVRRQMGHRSHLNWIQGRIILRIIDRHDCVCDGNYQFSRGMAPGYCSLKGSGTKL